MIFKIFPTKDTFISDFKKDAVPQTGSNYGASEILDLYKKTGISGAAGFAASSSISRVLIQWDLSEIAALTASGDAPATGVQYFLKLFDARHSGELPSSFDVEILPLSRSWDEGSGIDHENHLDKGVANWDKAKTSVWWTTEGGDYVTDVTASYHFDRGSENVEVDISNIVGAWLTGSLVNNGLMVKLTSNEETDSNDYYIKKFHGRETNYLDKRPAIEMKWDDSILDDRAVVVFDYSSSLFLYNKKRGQLADIDGVGTGNNVMMVKIHDENGPVMTVSASHTGMTGVYSASFYFPSASYIGSTFQDMWSYNGKSYMTGTFYPHTDGASSYDTQESYIVSVKNLKKQYEPNEVTRFNLFVRTRNYNPAVVNTGSLHMANTVIEKGYYRIDNVTTGEVVVPLGTGSIETTRLSRDGNGNYFKFRMGSLSPNEVYKMIFFFDIDGQLQKIDQNIKFKVV